VCVCVFGGFWGVLGGFGDGWLVGWVGWEVGGEVGMDGWTERIGVSICRWKKGNK